MAEQVGRPGHRLLKIVVGVPLVILGIVVVYALASLSDASFSGMTEAAVIAGVAVVVALLLWLLSRQEASRGRADQNGAASVLDGVRTAGWPPGRATAAPAPAPPRPTAPTLPRPTLVTTGSPPLTARSVSSAPSPASARRAPTIVPATPLPVSMKQWGTTDSALPKEPRRVLPGAPPNFAPAAASTPPSTARTSPRPPVSVASTAPPPAPHAPSSAPPRIVAAPLKIPAAAPVRRAAPSAPPAVRAVPLERPTPETPAHAGDGKEQERDTVTAAETPGESNALAEYLNSRAELANLIADVEAHMPNDVEPEPVVATPPADQETRVERELRLDREAGPAESEVPVAPEPPAAAEPVVATRPKVVAASQVAPARQVAPAASAPVESEPEVAVASEAAAGPEAKPAGEPEVEAAPAVAATPAADAGAAELLAQNTLMLTQAVEEVARASELIARAFELFTERVEADSLERRTLADAVMTLAQAATQTQMPASPSTPRLLGGSVFATPVWPHEDEIVIEDERPDRAERVDAPGAVAAERAGSTRTAPSVPRQSTWSGGS